MKRTKQILATIISLIILNFFVSSAHAQVVCNGDFTITDSIELDALSTCYRITGDLTITTTSLTHLDGLENLEIIDGYLDINNSPSLTSLSGLDNMTTVGGYLLISSNTSLISLSGLDNMTSVGDYLRISGNTALTSLSALKNITRVNGVFLYISDNTALTSLSGLDNITTTGGNLFIGGNAALTSLSGLDNITTIGGNLFIDDNLSLTSLSGLDNMTTIGGNMYVGDNPVLTSLSGLDNMTSVGGFLEINNNDTLVDLCALYDVVLADGPLIITNNQDLAPLTADALETELIANGYSTNALDDISLNTGTGGLFTCCEPTNLCPLEDSCGEILDDGCGNTLDCGGDDACSDNATCTDNICVLDCVPTIECPVGANCGEIDDGCGNTLDCGATCTVDADCSGAGTCDTVVIETGDCWFTKCPDTVTDCTAPNGTNDPACDVTASTCSTDICADNEICTDNICLCVPETTECSAEAECGVEIDECGGEIVCDDTCEGTDTCDLEANECICVPTEECPLLYACGVIDDDGCGNPIPCGTCEEAGEICNDATNLCVVDNSITVIDFEDYDLAIWDFSGPYAGSLPDNSTLAYALMQDSKGKLTGAGTFRGLDNMTIPVEVKGKVKLKKEIVTVDYKVKGKNDAGDKVDNKYKLELTLPSDPPAATEAEAAAAPDNETMVLEGTSKGKICVKGEKCENVEDEAVSLPVPDGMTGEALVTIKAEFDDKGKVTSAQSSLLLSNDDEYSLETKGNINEKKGERKFNLKGDNETTKGIKINAWIETDNGTATKISGKALGQKLNY